MSASPSLPLRAAVLWGDGPSIPRRPGGWDLILDLGSTERAPAGSRRVPWRSLLAPEEAEDLLSRCRAVLTGWHRDLSPRPPLTLCPGRVVETAALLELARVLKLVAILARLVRREGPIEAHVPAREPLARAFREATAHVDGIRLVYHGTLASGARRLAARVGAHLASFRTPPARGSPSVSGEAGGAIRVLGLANARNRVLLESLEQDPRFSVRLLERSAENRYLPQKERSAAAPAVRNAAGSWFAEALPALNARAREALGDIPGAPSLACDIVERTVRLLAPEAEAEQEGWLRLLARDPPDAIVSGIPWAGDLRTLALATERSGGPPLIAVQDGALSEIGAGGVPAGAGALAWGPLGRAWFERRGFPPGSVLAVGDPYLERLLDAVRSADPRPLRARLRLPEHRRVLLVSVQNSAPHVLAADPADPVRDVEVVLAGLAKSSGWCAILKPHPRLLLVDGRRRLALLHGLAEGVPAARVAHPGEPIEGLLALADAHAGEGDTLTLEALAAGKPAILVRREGTLALYPELEDAGHLPAVRSAEELASLLSRGLPPLEEAGRRRVLDLHLRAETTPAQAIARLARPCAAV